ncbi:sucrose-phosphate synthase [Methylophilus rhizosphaerae]|uniref:sucrose-phosphate synthase n=1 Tax=Methylophilus rhizosphaerae TaxID=492660 RepID=A0A1G9BHE1_9PROT|nr:HAD-IIB family hydrolase [Methylophilus rhizosphaerae]SDK38847.1 sucrose-phosphate synthase [Methylophilus rhizosphaerae]
MREQYQQKNDQLYVLLISVHGLIRGEALELGADADTGGQCTYVLDLAKALAEHPQIGKVDLLTRLIQDPKVSEGYAQAEEILSEKARIIRFPCGPRRYLRKEALWPHLDQIVDRCLHYLRHQGRLPDVIHSHYADAGYVGRQLSMLLGIPQIHTGHSLGRPKQERLLSSGRKAQTIEKQFNFERRIAEEEALIQHASLIVTSTRQEVELQYGMYTHPDPKRFRIIPPGTDTSRFLPPDRKHVSPTVEQSVGHFLENSKKPIILCICRPELRKNLKGLVAAYGNNEALQRRANLVLVAGSREDIRTLDKSQAAVLTELLLDIDTYDLWGKVAIPKNHAQEDVPEFYRMAAKSRGIFINAAFTEPFGLTLLEAGACGLPVIAPDDGGPRDILANCHHGLLVNTLDSTAIGDTLLSALTDRPRWRKWAKSGVINVKRHYTWAGHVNKYVKEIRNLLRRQRKNLRKQQITLHSGKSHIPLAQHAFITDIDNTLLGDRAGQEALVAWLRENAGYTIFGIATGRPLESTMDILRKNHIPIPDVLITSVGSEIHYGLRRIPDIGWANHIRHQWRRDDVLKAMEKIPGLRLQSAENQREFKISYLVDTGKIPSMEHITQHLRKQGLHAQVIYSHGEFLDLLPVRASKGHAIRYLSYKWGLPLTNFLVSGDSGNDIEMLVGDTMAVVVGNYSEDLAHLKGSTRIYFAEASYAHGILEGMQHYKFGTPAAEKEHDAVLLTER